MRTLVINLTRFGDLLQTQPVFTGLKAEGHEVGLACLQNFVPAASLVRDLDAVFAIPGARLLAGLDISWPHALGDCLEWAAQVRRTFRPQRVINLTSSLPARLLARSLSDGEILGFGLDEFGYGVYSSPWAAFLEATSRHRGSSPFNLVDIFFRAAHLAGPDRVYRLATPKPQVLESVWEMIGAQYPPPHSGLAGIQLGASAEKRRWPVEHFERAAAFLWEKHNLLPVLLGSKGEEPLAEQFSASARFPHVNLVAKTGLEELAACASLLKLLVTNDTGTMHLAAGLGVPVLSLFLATAQPWDTGPYLPGSCCLEPDMPCHPCPFDHECAIGWVCREKLSSQAAVTLLDGWLTTGHWPEIRGLGARAWETVREPDGFIGLRSLSGHGQGERALWNEIQRKAWRRFLDALPPEFSGDEALGLPEEFRSGIYATLSQVSSLLDVLLAQAQVLKMSPRPALRTKFMATWQRVESLLSSNNSLSALAHLWLHLSQNESQDLSRFTAFAGNVSRMVSSLTSLLAPRP